MEAAVVGAVIGAIGTVTVGFLANFVAEDYRRHRDSCALAGALAGELASYRDAWPLLQLSLNGMLNLAQSGIGVKIPGIPKPTDRVFDANVGRLGLLGPQLAEDLAYVYNQINAFRELFKTLVDEPGLAHDLQATRLAVCLQTLERTLNRGESLPDQLREFATRTYRPFMMNGA